jgi:hypothetical protein
MSLGKRHTQRSDGRQKEVELDLQVVDEGDVERVEELGRGDVQLDLGQSFAGTRSLAEAERKNQTLKES